MSDEAMVKGTRSLSFPSAPQRPANPVNPLAQQVAISASRRSSDRSYDELGYDAHLVPGMVDAAFQHRVHVELLRDLPDRLGRSLVDHHGGARDHSQVLDARCMGRDVFRHAVADGLGVESFSPAFLNPCKLSVCLKLWSGLPTVVWGREQGHRISRPVAFPDCEASADGGGDEVLGRGDAFLNRFLMGQTGSNR